MKSETLLVYTNILKHHEYEFTVCKVEKYQFKVFLDPGTAETSLMIGSCVVLYQKDLLQISIIHFIHFFILRWEIPPTYVNAFYDVARNKMGNLYPFQSSKYKKQSFADVLQNKCSWNFCKFHRKTLVLESPFNKVTGFQASNFIKKRLQHRCFPVKFAKFLRTPFFTEHLRWLLLK